MTLGGGIVLIVLGAIFLFALEVDIPGLGQDALGWILILAGVLVVVLAMVQQNTRRKHHTVAVTRHADGRETVSEQRTATDPPPQV